MNIGAIDLNLLKAFNALYEERNVTRAGTAIGLAQPSMSNALNRLRHLFADELFVRTPQGMVPTERAKLLAPKVASVLDIVLEAVSKPLPFDPATVQAEIAIATGDNIQMTHGASLAAHFNRVAPRFDLRMRQLNKDTIHKELDYGSVDMVIGRLEDLPARFFQHELFKDRFVCIARKNHPALNSTMTKKQFASIPQVLMTLRADDSGAVDVALKKHGLSRRVALTVGQFLVIPDIVSRTDHIAAIPASLASVAAERSGCDVYPMPVTIAPWSMTLVWSQSTQADPAKRYALEQIKTLAFQD